MAVKRMMSTALDIIKTGEVHDNYAKSFLSIKLNKFSAIVRYEKDGDIYDLISTHIPDQYQGGGLGSAFAERIFDYLIQRNKRMRLTCEFLEKFYSKNLDKYEGHVVD